ncbi:MAG: hypothetical protein WAO71_05185 [Gallionella sp.]
MTDLRMTARTTDEMRITHERGVDKFIRIIVMMIITVQLASCGGGGTGGGSSSGGGGGGSNGVGSAVGGAVGVIGAVIVLANIFGSSIVDRVKETSSRNTDTNSNTLSTSLRIATTFEARTGDFKGNKGFVALLDKESQHKRNLLFCSKFLEAFIKQQSEEGSREGTPLSTLYWTFTDNQNQSIDKSDCNELLQRYDYSTFTGLFDDALFKSSSGPLLVSFEQSSSRTPTTKSTQFTVIWDLSPIAPSDFPFALKAWAKIQALPVDKLKEFLSSPSYSDTVESILNQENLQRYTVEDIKISLTTSTD